MLFKRSSKSGKACKEQKLSVFPSSHHVSSAAEHPRWSPSWWLWSLPLSVTSMPDLLTSCPSLPCPTHCLSTQP